MKTPQMERIGQTVRRFRTQRGLTQAQLAEKCGINSVTLSGVERGANTSIYLLERLSWGLDIPFSHLFDPVVTPEGAEAALKEFGDATWATLVSLTLGVFRVTEEARRELNEHQERLYRSFIGSVPQPDSSGTELQKGDSAGRARQPRGDDTGQG